ncbi:MAG: superfamily I DNA and RNA helicase [Halonotius sp. J07HN4]|jgi:ATP-dependent DNA helicase, Rep family|nr:MAG: superfamily I DNA and RNA helicase [Halonotius sp. J07HN4]
MEQVLIAGDDDQVVYAWQGADPNLLLDADHDENEVLPNSYRLPSNILNVVNQEIRHLDKRQEKDLKPRKEGGSVEAVENASILELVRNVRYTVDAEEGSIMLLFRARYQLFQFIEEFVDEGIPFKALTDQRLWTDRLTDYVHAIEAIDAGEELTLLQGRRLADMLQESTFGSNDREEFYDFLEAQEEAAEIDDLAEVPLDPDAVEDFAPFMPDPKSAGDMLRKVTNFQRSSVDAYFNGDYAGLDPDTVRVGTIHSAKGREADHVFVATDLTEKVVEQMAATVAGHEEAADPTTVGDDEFTKHTDPVPLLTDNERRVFYVGMSRARERLVLLENLIDGAPTVPISVLLHDEIRDEPPEELLDAIEPAEPDAPEPEP